MNMNQMRTSMLIEDPFEELRKSQFRQNQEICQRFVRLSCHKMLLSRGTGNLRRNLLILHLLQKARRDMQQVPAECKSLLLTDEPIQPPNIMAMRRSGGSPRPSSSGRKPLIGRSFQPQVTTPKRWPFNSQRPTINTSNLISRPQEKQSVQPTTPPPVDETLKTSSAFELAYQALANNDDDVFVDEGKENKEEDVEELFLQKIGKSPVSPPISPEKQVPKEENTKLAGRRLDFTTSNNMDDIFSLSDTFTGKIESEPVKLHDVTLESDSEDLPPFLFCCDEDSEKKMEVVEKHLDKNEDRVVPNRLTRSSISLYFDSEDMKLKSEEESSLTDGEITEEEDETTDFGPRFPSFKRRLRKRKPGANVRSANIFILAEKRPKDSPDILYLGRYIGEMSRRYKEDHCVPSISI